MPPQTENELNGISTANSIDELVNRFGGEDGDNDDDKKTKQPTNNNNIGIGSTGTVYPGNNLGRCLAAGEWVSVLFFYIPHIFFVRSIYFIFLIKISYFFFRK